MKKFVMIVAVAALALVVSSQLASAGRRGGCGSSSSCGGRSHGGHSCGSSCGSSCGGGGYVSGCASGSCGYAGGCATGSCGTVSGYAGCSTCGTASYSAAPCATCAGGVCTLNPSTGIALAEASSTEATIVVNLPEDATLTIDNQPTASTSANRVFVSPTLESGKDYQYTLKAEVVREGKTQTTTRRVTVRAGQVSRIELTVPATGVAAQ